jgi:hypothetical protein
LAESPVKPNDALLMMEVAETGTEIGQNETHI